MRRKQIGNRAMQAPAPNRAAQAAKAKADFLHLDQRLDEALKETFPASDPIALTPQNGGFLVQSGSVDGDRVEESPRLAAADDGLPGSDRPNAQRMVQRRPPPTSHSPVVIERILAATDFSPSGERAVEVAAEWARRAAAQLRVVHVTPPRRWFGRSWGFDRSMLDRIDQQVSTALKETAGRADPNNTLELSTGVLTGAAARSIVHAAREYKADLIIVGARGEHGTAGERFLGGTSAKLLDRAPVPLLLVRRPRNDVATGVVAALDLSPHSRAVLEWAHYAAADQHLFAYHVYDTPFAPRLQAYGLAASAVDMYSNDAQARCEADLTELVDSIGGPAVTTTVVERGDPGILVGRYVDSIRPSLIVVGRHAKKRRSSPASSVGSVRRYVAASAAADLLAV